MKELDFEALTSPARNELEGIERLVTLFDDMTTYLDSEAVQPTGVETLRALMAFHEQTERAVLALASALHGRGVSTRTLGEATGMAHSTIHRRMKEYAENRQG